MNKEKKYTVGEVCEMFGITRKTLFYYDKIDLVEPAERVGVQNHKIYDQKGIERLQEVLRYREAGLTIEEIKKIINGDKADTIALLEGIKERLLNEQNSKTLQIENLERLIEMYRGKIKP